MPCIAIWDAFEFTANNGGTLEDGSLDVPTLVPASTEPIAFQNQLVLDQGEHGTLWDAANNPTDFTYLRIASDKGDEDNGYVIIETTTDENGTYGTKYATFALRSGVPFILGSSQSYANYTANFGGGTLSTIQRIRVKNLNSAQATVALWLVQ
jgi:hypothetical protein